ncbi:hypothetical protein GCM10018773_35280 [Streptomyces candidus]|nr:hypothetical protein GCM10018773_35280 [Streptomyces candidus]
MHAERVESRARGTCPDTSARHDFLVRGAARRGRMRSGAGMDRHDVHSRPAPGEAKEAHPR